MDRDSGVQDAVSSALRLPEVAARVVPGHWEGDLIKGARNAPAVGTLVERTSRRIMLVKLQAMNPQAVIDGFTRRLRCIPRILRKSLTHDRGSEMSLHKTLTKRLHRGVFFRDAYKPSQRATDENFNGLVREYLPKGTELSKVTTDPLRFIEDRLNNRPRQILGFKTPSKIFSKLLAEQDHGVALRA